MESWRQTINFSIIFVVIKSCTNPLHSVKQSVNPGKDMEKGWSVGS